MIFRMRVGVDPPSAAAANQAHRKWPHINAKRELKTHAYIDAHQAKRAFIDAKPSIPRNGESGVEPPLFLGPVKVRATINWAKKRKRQDVSNLSYALKAVWDGLTDAGIWTDDKQIVEETVSQTTFQGRYGKDSKRSADKPTDGSVEIEIEGALNPYYDRRDGITLVGCETCGAGYRARDLDDNGECPVCAMRRLGETRSGIPLEEIA